MESKHYLMLVVPGGDIVLSRTESSSQNLINVVQGRRLAVLMNDARLEFDDGMLRKFNHAGRPKDSIFEDGLNRHGDFLGSY